MCAPQLCALVYGTTLVPLLQTKSVLRNQTMSRSYSVAMQLWKVALTTEFQPGRARPDAAGSKAIVIGALRRKFGVETHWTVAFVRQFCGVIPSEYASAQSKCNVLPSAVHWRALRGNQAVFPSP
ncbi:uncharacterized protein BJ171DRAFT_496455 [Polychytrium aggregatum]|uniref:uncharacterized protein n=1 Tax=Polychytrium aggregatum TaxID=110093 RepID=UPI0022FE05AA|nr:uncharacterized protein BJ171DRAFT_496455 [Polychytrium aggregatum]KAI9206637.1 hypothetical protein BJ171DRAFT_496455 [Polychytrium aggregatum]